MLVARLLGKALAIFPVPEVAVSKVNGLKMLLYPKRGAIHRDLYLHQEREVFCTEYLKRLNVGSVCLDIGANIGYYALLESRLVGSQGMVYAIEPVQGNFDVLKKNVSLNRLTNIKCFQLAAGQTDADSEIYISPSANLCSMIWQSGNVLGAQPVHVVSVDSFLSDKLTPDLVRMDVEGYEYEILAGMQKTLHGNTRILVEIHPMILKEKLANFLSLLASNGYCAKFVAFETKTEQNKLMGSLLRKAGYDLPCIRYDLSISELYELLLEKSAWCPNVLFEKKVVNH